MVSLADKVFTQLEQDILTERYAPGDILTEGRLSQALGVSRTPIRVAIFRLEQSGLLQECGKGMIVVGLTGEDLADIFEIRRRLEGLAARRAAQKKDPSLLQQLKEIVELQEFYTAKGNASNIQALDSKFHKIIYDNCGSILRDTLSSLHRRIQRYRGDSVRDLTRAADAAGEHRGIYEAIAQGDGEKAEQLTVEHVCNAYAHMIQNKTKE